MYWLFYNHCHYSESWETILQHVERAGKEQNSKLTVWFLLNVDRSCIIIKFKTLKLNHRKSGTICIYCLPNTLTRASNASSWSVPTATLMVGTTVQKEKLSEVKSLAPGHKRTKGRLLLLLLSHLSRVRLCTTPQMEDGSAIPGILQARTLEWVAISFSNAWKWKVKVKSPSRVWLLLTPWTAAHQAALSMGFSRREYWSGVPSGIQIQIWPIPNPMLLTSRQ